MIKHMIGALFFVVFINICYMLEAQACGGYAEPKAITVNCAAC